MTLARASLVWLALALAIALPFAAAATSPLLAWRDPIYIIAGFAGVIGLSLLLLQPLLAGGSLPGLGVLRGRQVHRWIGAGVLAAIVIHVAALWITSPPDVVDALLFNSPTPFSVWGVIAMWAAFAAGLLAALWRKLRVRPSVWRKAHLSLATVVVVGSVMHAILIEGTMETVTKIGLCALVVAATGKLLYDRGVRAPSQRRLR